MELHMTTFLIVCPLVFLAGFVDAIGGGGGLISLPAYYLAGVPIHHAIATNKLSSATGTLISTIRIGKSGKIRDCSGRSDGIDRIISGNQTEYSDR